MVGKVSGKTARIINMVIICALLILFGLLCLFPFYMLFVNATRSTLQIQSSISFLPSRYFFENYNSLAENGLNVFRAFLNSFVIAVASTFLSVYVSALTAFAFHVYRFKGSNLLYAILLATIMIPGQLGLIGFYQLMLELQWLDSYLPLILPSMASATTVFFMRQYFSSTLSVDIIEAARIDGASELRTCFGVILPMVKPGIGALAIFTFITAWNDYFMQLIMLTKNTSLTISLGIANLQAEMATDFGLIMAGAAVAAIPILAVFLMFQKYFTQGITMGAVKG